MTRSPQADPTFLSELTIRNFALVDHLRIEWSPGLNIITGETGAGKSIIIDALGAALGDRLDPIWLRSGSNKALVEAVFSAPRTPPDLNALFEELGCPPDESQMILARDILAGRSLSRINGRALPLNAVLQVAMRLVDVHSQASHLLRTREHLEILDRYGHAAPLRAAMASAAQTLSKLRAEIIHLEGSERQAQREAGLLSHELAEITSAALHPDEEADLLSRRTRLKNALRLTTLAMDAHGALRGSDDQPGAISLIEHSTLIIDQIASIDPEATLHSDRVADLLDAAEDLARELQRYAEAVEEDQPALDQTEERLLQLADLKRKYGATLAEVIAYGETATQRLSEIERRDELLADLKAKEGYLVATAVSAAQTLSLARHQAALSLEQAVEHELSELGMPNTCFCVAFSTRTDPSGLIFPGDTLPLRFDESGADIIEFTISPNRGEDPRPLARVASGGELARIMLALKSVIAEADATPVLIFDELDQGVGGRMGHVIGEKLFHLSRTHQVICITHLPQVAAYADAHYIVAKIEADERTITTVRLLDQNQQIEELAAMLAGERAGPAAHRSASELLTRATEWKLHSTNTPGPD